MTYGFSFLSEADSDLYRSLTGLCNKNGGFFRSTKQRWFIFTKSMMTPWGMDPCVTQRGEYAGVNEADSQKAKDFFGVDVPVGMRLYMVTATMRWAAGTRARREVEWAFVVDALGVVRKYKLHRLYNASGTASSINAAKTQVEFERAADAVVPAELAAALATEKARVAELAAMPFEVGNHVGRKGKREVFELTVDFVKNLGWKQVAYNVGCESWLVVAHDAAGNTVKMFGGFGADVAKGEVIKVKATVKDHTYFKGRAETIVNRCKAC